VRLQPGLSAVVGIRDADSAATKKSAGSPDSFLATSVILADPLATPTQNKLKP